MQDYKTQYIMRKDGKLLKLAKKIFGNVVTEAYVTTIHYRDEKLTDAIDRMKSNLKEIAPEEHNDQISCDTMTIIFKFKSGNMVAFTNSEWGSIYAFKQETKEYVWREV